MHVSVGQHVSQGQLLATLDPTSAHLLLSQAQEQLDGRRGPADRGGERPATADRAARARPASTGSSTSTSYEGGRRHDRVRVRHHQQVADDRVRRRRRLRRRLRPPRPRRRRDLPAVRWWRRLVQDGSGSGSVQARRLRRRWQWRIEQSQRRLDGGGSARRHHDHHEHHANAGDASPRPRPPCTARRRSVNNAEQRLNNTKLYAPTSGTIASLASLLPGRPGRPAALERLVELAARRRAPPSGIGGSGLAGGTATAGSLGGSGSSLLVAARAPHSSRSSTRAR